MGLSVEFSVGFSVDPSVEFSVDLLVEFSMHFSVSFSVGKFAVGWSLLHINVAVLPKHVVVIAGLAVKDIAVPKHIRMSDIEVIVNTCDNAYLEPHSEKT